MVAISRYSIIKLLEAMKEKEEEEEKGRKTINLKSTRGKKELQGTTIKPRAKFSKEIIKVWGIMGKIYSNYQKKTISNHESNHTSANIFQELKQNRGIFRQTKYDNWSPAD